MTDDVRQLYSIRASNAITVTTTCEKHMFLRRINWNLQKSEQQDVEDIILLFKTAAALSKNLKKKLAKSHINQTP